VPVRLPGYEPGDGRTGRRQPCGVRTVVRSDTVDIASETSGPAVAVATRLALRNTGDAGPARSMVRPRDAPQGVCVGLPSMWFRRRYGRISPPAVAGTVEVPADDVEVTANGATPPRSGIRAQIAARASWNVIDQIISSASNFALSILIARSVDSHTFGAFATSFTLFSFLIGITRAIGRYPLIIAFGGASRDEYRRATRSAAGTILSFGIAAGLVTAVVGYVLGGREGAALLAMGLVLPLVLLQDGWRGALIGAGRPKAAALNDAVWTVSQFAAVGGLLAAGGSSASALVFTWGLSGGLAAGFGVVQTGAVPRLQDTWRWLVAHWNQCGFFLAEWVLVLGAAQSSLLVIAAYGSVRDVGALRAAQVLLGPLNLVAASAFDFLIAELARRRTLRPGDQFRAAYLTSGALAVACLSWGGVLLALPSSIGRQLLGDTWPLTREVLPASVLWSCAIVLSTGPAVVLRVLNRARVSFEINAVTAPLLVILGLLGLHLGGAAGAAAGFALANWLTAPLWWIRVRLAAQKAAALQTSQEPVQEGA
jgi:O-antigen/teichoic acid export membrane protein